MLGSDYHTKLIIHDAQPGPVGKITWPQVREEYRLTVHRDSPGQPGGPPGVGRGLPSDPAVPPRITDTAMPAHPAAIVRRAR